jgi:hypothetical protein
MEGKKTQFWAKNRTFGMQERKSRREDDHTATHTSLFQPMPATSTL